ncbi:MAG: hypothetical protein QOF12_2967 [Solirubrobacteraceae bacterium]|nr:hypothetical protein [Solirubrobacteraceae bacterium]
MDVRTTHVGVATNRYGWGQSLQASPGSVAQEPLAVRGGYEIPTRRSYPTMKFRLPLAVLATAAALAIPAGSAMAANTPEQLSGVTLGTLAIAAGTGAVFTSNFAPGGVATQTGALTATDTSPSWSLKARDAGTGAGHMVAAATGCTGSDSQLTNATQVSITSPLGGVTPDAAISLSGTDQPVASATSQLLAANVLVTHYSVTIPTAQQMLTGCAYSQNVTYTLQ